MGDEGRYLEFAGNLLQGYYSPKDTFSLWNGPGYPIAIAPLVAVGAPRFLILLANAFFQYLSVVFLFKTLTLFTHRRAALALTIGWGLYFTAYETLPYVLSDTFATLLATLAAYFTIKTLKDGKGAWKAGLIWGWLLLTKVIFAYVFPVVLTFHFNKNNFQWMDPTCQKGAGDFWNSLSYRHSVFILHLPTHRPMVLLERFGGHESVLDEHALCG